MEKKCIDSKFNLQIEEALALCSKKKIDFDRSHLPKAMGEMYFNKKYLLWLQKSYFK